MTLPSSGSLSISQIAAEFGISLPCVFPTAFYGKPGVPASGALVLPTTFHGLSNVIFTPDGGAVTVSTTGTDAATTLACNLAAVWTFSLPANVTASIASGGSSASLTLTLQNGGGGSYRERSISVTGTAFGVVRSFTVTLIVDNT